MSYVAAIAILVAAMAGLAGDQLNRSYNTSEAEKNREFNREEREAAQAFNAEEAAKNREWQEYMSSTAHQREVNDLKAAGLNPVLSANSGASVGSGATASSPFGGSSASASYNGNSLSQLGKVFSSAYATEMDVKLKSQPKFSQSSDKYYRNGKLVREVTKNGFKGIK